jgi:diguanylate cyclase (GGDEF)-like protein
LEDINDSRQSRYNVMFFVLKILALFFCASPLFQYFFKDMSSNNLDNVNLAVFTTTISVFLIITFMWIMMDRNRKKIRFATVIELVLFFSICIASILLSGGHESYYKFLFMFIVVSYTIEMDMKTGFIVAALASLFIFGIDLYMHKESGVNTYFQTDIALCSMFAVTAWILGSYVKVANEHIEQLIDLTNMDGLTNIYNHRYFQDKLKEKCNESVQTGEPLSLIMVDIDYFKAYNDIYGHQKGDTVLKQLAELLTKIKRDDDILCRYGGEEFVLILSKTSKEDAMEIGENIRKSVDEFPFEGEELLLAGSITVSVGVAGFNGEHDDPVGLINRTDTALYRAKFLQRNRVEQYVSVFDNASRLDDKITSLKSLINVIHSRDSYTYDHTERVVWYCQLYADYMKFSDNEKTKLVYSAYLHDLGKINVSKSTLISTGKLSDKEWEEMKRHPVDSARMICNIEGLEEIVDIVLHHHERYDGKGYPDGIAGDDINLLARILAVADGFDAMTSERPYQPARTDEEAFAEIRRCKGTQYDPEVAENFISALKNLLSDHPTTKASDYRDKESVC